MIHVKKEGIVLQKTTLEFENEGVLNPAVIKEGNLVHIFYRAVRKGNNSTIGHCIFDGPLVLKERFETPVLIPETPYESRGVEDPRIVKIDDTFYLTYTAYDGVNALSALALSTDLKSFHRVGIIVPQVYYEDYKYIIEHNLKLNKKYVTFQEHYNSVNTRENNLLLWDKNVMFFPRRIQNKLAFLHRIRPGIQIVQVEDLKELTLGFWEDYLMHLDKYIIIDPLFAHENGYVGGGCPPIETPQGWLIIYHGTEYVGNGHIYCACAALFDLEDPCKEIARLPYPLFFPEYVWEKTGEVNNVVFPTGTALFDDTLYIYYGAADEHIACASVSLSELVEELLSKKVQV